MSKQIIFGGGKRKRTRHIFVGKRVASLPPPSQQSDFYKKTKAKIENATADFLKDEKIRQNASLTYTPSEENFILEATKGGGKSLLKKRGGKSPKKRTKRKKRGYGGKSPKKRGYGGKSPKRRRR